MGLTQALSSALSGLRVTQTGISVVATNVANAETPGYVRKSVIQVAGMTGDYGSSVLLNGVDRQLDQYLQTQLRTETSGAAYADIRATFLANLQNVYGNPGETGTIEDSFNKLLTAFQGLSIFAGLVQLTIVISSLLAVMLALSGVIVGYWLGDLIVDRLNWPDRAAGAMVIGVALIAIATSIPILGWLVSLAVIAVGVGTILLAIIQARRQADGEPAPAVA